MASNRSAVGTVSFAAPSGPTSTPLITTSPPSPHDWNCSGNASWPKNLEWCPNGVQPGNNLSPLSIENVNRPSRPVSRPMSRLSLAAIMPGTDDAGPITLTMKHAHSRAEAHASSANFRVTLAHIPESGCVPRSCLKWKSPCCVPLPDIAEVTRRARRREVVGE